MKKYLINLAEASERLETQRAQFGRLGMEFERFEAYRDDAQLLDRFRWWCAVLRPWVKGEIGCARSHVGIYEKLVESGEACSAVFEDDVVLSDAVKTALELAEQKCREDSKAIVLLGDHRKGKRGADVAEGNVELRVEKTEWDDCTDGYVVGREAAAALAKAQRRVRVPADWWAYFRRKGYVRLYRVTPPVCRQDLDRFESSLGKRYVVAEHGAVAWVWWKIRRCIGVAIETMRR